MREADQQIIDWRNQLSLAGCDLEVIDELESHLRDEIHRLVLAGTPEEKAKEIAIASIGAPAELAAEFAKVVSTAPWLPIRLAYGVLFLMTVLTCSLVVSAKGRVLAQPTTMLLSVHVVSITLGYLTTLATGSIAICYIVDRLFRGLTPGQFRSLHRATFQLSAGASLFIAIGIVMAAIWSKEKFGRYWNWEFREIGACLTLCLTLMQTYLARRRLANVHSQMQIALVGNIVVMAAWLGYQVFHGMQQNNLIVLMSFFAFQLAAVAVSAMPARILRRQRA